MKSENSIYNTLILANGEFPFHEIPIRLLEEASQIICCDGAVNPLVDAGYHPSVIIGDMDSISAKNRKLFQKIIQQNSSKEHNDLTKALHYCLNSGYSAASIVGGSGLREDHFLGNIGVMMMFAEERGMDLQMVTNYGVFTPIFQSTEFHSFPGQQVSVFSLSPETELTFEGLRYPVYERTFSYLWEGALNEATGEGFHVKFSKGKVLVYRAFP